MLLAQQPYVLDRMRPEGRDVVALVAQQPLEGSAPRRPLAPHEGREALGHRHLQRGVLHVQQRLEGRHDAPRLGGRQRAHLRGHALLDAVQRQRPCEGLQHRRQAVGVQRVLLHGREARQQGVEATAQALLAAAHAQRRGHLQHQCLVRAGGRHGRAAPGSQAPRQRAGPGAARGQPHLQLAHLAALAAGGHSLLRAGARRTAPGQLHAVARRTRAQVGPEALGRARLGVQGHDVVVALQARGRGAALAPQRARQHPAHHQAAARAVAHREA
ncbi:MAG: hypothetical protein ACKOSS_05125 [Planctomycetia bacterium]